MKKLRYRVSVQGLSSPRGTISFTKLKTISGVLSEGAERALRLAIEGQSVKKGPTPAWLSKSTDFVLAGMVKGSTTLVVDAPTLGTVARDQISQTDLWDTPPKAYDTALTILSQALHDASSVPGLLNTIEHSKKRFQLSMKNGETPRGKIDENLIATEQMRKFWGQQVTIKGFIHFKASGKPRFLEAHAIEASQAGDELFESIAVPHSPTQIWTQIKAELANRDVVAEIRGKWPGDESIEQLLDMLKSSEKVN